MEAPINFLDYRQKNKMPADALRSICKGLEIEIYREGTEHLMPFFNNKYKLETETLLNHALVEYKSTGDIKSTKAGNFMIFTPEDTSTNTEKVSLISNFIKPTEIPTQSISREIEPRKEPENILVSKSKMRALTKVSQQNIAPISQNIENEKLIEIVTAISKINQRSQQSVLYNQKELMIALEQNFLLTHEQVAELTGWSKSTISAKKISFVRYGFTFTKVKEGSTTLWRVTRK